jgi:hypothetical protein
MTREELIEYIKQNDRKFTYEENSFIHFKYEELFMLKRRIDEENDRKENSELKYEVKLPFLN